MQKPLATDWQKKWLRLEVTRPAVQSAAHEVEKWSARFGRHKLVDPESEDNRGHLVIVGDYGVGKTAIAERLLAWARGIRIMVWPKFWPKIPRVEFVEFSQVAFLEAEEFRTWLTDHSHADTGTDLMFLEDIGAEVDRFSKGEPTERLREILNAMKNRWMVITTNVPVDDWQTRWDGRVADRLFRNSVVIEMTDTPSYQITKHEHP